MMEKQLYFAKVKLIEALEEQAKGLHHKWNEYTCWYGTLEEQEAHDAQTKAVYDRIKETKAELEEARKDIDKATLKSWADEYYGRK